MRTKASVTLLRSVTLTLFLLSAAQLFPATSSSKVTLRVETPTGVRTVTKKELEALIVPGSITVMNPEDRKIRTYVGFWLEDVLKICRFSKGEIYFICADGYTASLSQALVGRHQWLFAFGERDGAWTLLNHKGQLLSPAPWYLVGTSTKSYQDLPWPYQVVGIRSYKNW